MKAINKTATRTLEKLLAGLDEPGDHRKFDNAPGAFMPVSVDCLAPDLFAVAHYYEQYGDLISDPDMVILRGSDGRYYPIEITQPFGYTRAVELDADRKPVRWSPRAQRDLATFAGTWLRNIKAQQF